MSKFDSQGVKGLRICINMTKGARPYTTQFVHDPFCFASCNKYNNSNYKD